MYNLIQQGVRTVRLNINRNWGDGTSLLGATLRLEAYNDSHNHVLAVKNVLLGGPAQVAGIQPDKDFILGTREIAFKSLEDFAKYVEVNECKEIILHIYNTMSETVREVPLIPSWDWDGQGLLGCDVSFGYFNRLPLRGKDLKNLEERKGLLGVFDKLSTDAPPPKPVEQTEPPKEEERTSEAVFEIEDVPIKPGEIIDESTVLQEVIASGKSSVSQKPEELPVRPKRSQRKIHMLPTTLDFS